MNIFSEGNGGKVSTEYFRAKNGPPPGGAYSHGAVAHGFLFTCGMGPLDPLTGLILEGDIAEQTRQTLKNLQVVVAERGSTFAKVVKVTAYLHNIRRDFGAYDLVYREYFHEPFPVRTTIGAELVQSLISIDLVLAL